MRHGSPVCTAFVALCLFGSSPAPAENPVSAEEHGAQRELTEADVAGWRTIGRPALTPDGQWLAYLDLPLVVPLKGPAVVVLRGVASNTERRYPAGEASVGGGTFGMSASGRWIAFQVATGARTEAGLERLDLALIEVASGARRDFRSVQSFEFAAITGRQQRVEHEKLVLQSYAGAGKAKASELRVFDLERANEQLLQGVVSFSVSPTGSRVVVAAEDGLRDLDVSSGRVRALDSSGPAEYVRLVWSDGGNALAALRRRDAATTLLILARLEHRVPAKRELHPATWAGFPEGHALATSLRWRSDEEGLFFTIRQIPPQSVPGAVPNLRLWHWQDDLLPGQRRLRDQSPPSQWCFVSVDRGKFVRLADPALPDIEPHDSAPYVLGYDERAYGRLNASAVGKGGAAPVLRDYYLVDLQSGRRSLLARRLKVWTRMALSVEPALSPSGAVFLHQNDMGDVIARNVRTRADKNLTAALPTTFYLPENDPRTGWAPRETHYGSPRVQGWTRDGNYVLVSDHYDVWALPLRSAPAINLTGNGREQDISYRREVLTEPASRRNSGSRTAPDLNAAMYFHMSDWRTGKRGIARWVPGSADLQVLHTEYADIQYTQAARANTVIFSRMTAGTPMDFYRAGADWSAEARLTDVSPQQRQMRMSPGARYLSYLTKRGERRNAALLLPAGYVPGRTYPTIVEIYMTRSDTVHSYRYPAHYQSAFLRRGYALLLPDMYPRMDDTGQSAVDHVLAAIDAAVAAGVVDRARLGLTAHSYGAYQANFIISQTHAFRIAVSEAGMTELWSHCTRAYQDAYPSGCERSQPFLSGPWWERWDAYVRNSPLSHASKITTPLLLVHGDRDGAVDFAQSVQLFNTLRDMGGKQVVLLEYKGEGHELSPASASDVRDRSLALFDHFLKDAPAPEWWVAGTSRYEGGVPAH